MKKIIASILLCMVFTFSMLVVWNWAPQFAELTNLPTRVFDGLAAILLFAAMIMSCLFNEGREELKAKKNI